MSLFDQQPMGPVPARRPVVIPEDPALAELGIDPTGVPIRVVEPAPAELRRAMPSRPRRHRLRVAVGLLLLLPTALSLGAGILSLSGAWASADAPPIDTTTRIAFLLAVALVGAVVVGAYAIFRRGSR
jgi:hypothetical protein